MYLSDFETQLTPLERQKIEADKKRLFELRKLFYSRIINDVQKIEESLESEEEFVEAKKQEMDYSHKQLDRILQKSLSFEFSNIFDDFYYSEENIENFFLKYNIAFSRVQNIELISELIELEIRFCLAKSGNFNILYFSKDLKKLFNILIESSEYFKHIIDDLFCELIKKFNIASIQVKDTGLNYFPIISKDTEVLNEITIIGEQNIKFLFINAPNIQKILIRNCRNLRKIIVLQKTLSFDCENNLLLESVICPNTSKVAFSSNKELKEIVVLEATDISCLNNESLTILRAPNVESIICFNNNSLTELLVQSATTIHCFKNSSITSLLCAAANKITFSNNPILTQLILPNATSINCFDNEALKNLFAPNAVSIFCLNNESLEVILCPQAEEVNFSYNKKLTQLTLPNAKSVICSCNLGLRELKFPNAVKVECCDCSNLEIISVEKAEEVECSNNPNLKTLITPKAKIINLNNCKNLTKLVINSTTEIYLNGIRLQEEKDIKEHFYKLEILYETEQTFIEPQDNQHNTHITSETEATNNLNPRSINDYSARCNSSWLQRILGKIREIKSDRSQI